MKLFYILSTVVIVLLSFSTEGEGAINNVTQLSFPLKWQKPPLHRMMEMGFHPQVIETLILGKKKPPHPDTVTNDTVQLFKYVDNEFYAQILIGHPGRTFNVILDTTWADSYLPSIHCSLMSLACQSRKNKYDGSKSFTHIDLNTKFSLGGYIGNQVMDLLHLGHVNVTNHTFAELTDMPAVLYVQKADGIFGMGFKDLISSNYQGIPFFYKLIQQYPKLQPVFSFYMNKDETTHKGGSLILGEIAKKHYSGELNYVKVTKPKFWLVNMDKVLLDTGKKTYTYCEKGCEAIFDTGSGVIGVPTEDLDRLNRMIGANKFITGRYTVDCRTYLKLPEILFVLNGKEYKIKGKEYVQQVVYGPVHVCLTAFMDSGVNNTWTLGGAFLYRYYTVYDMTNQQVGLAPANL